MLLPPFVTCSSVDMANTATKTAERRDNWTLATAVLDLRRLQA